MSMPFMSLAAAIAFGALVSSASAEAIVTQRESRSTPRAHGGCRDRALPQGRFHVSVTIVDSGGNIRLHERDDGASPHTVDASFRKAYTSRSYRVPSADFMKRTEIGGGGRPGLRRSTMLGVPGGLPIKVGDETIGGIGVAGAPGDKATKAAPPPASRRSRIAQIAERKLTPGSPLTDRRWGRRAQHQAREGIGVAAGIFAVVTIASHCGLGEW